MNSLKLIKYQFTLRFTATTLLPPFIGNVIRGALGQSLYDQACESGMKTDDPQDAFSQVFKTSSMESIPNPYVLSVPYPSEKRYEAGDTLTFHMTLLGSAGRFLPQICLAARQMCKGQLSNCILDSHATVYDREWSDSGAQSIAHCDVLTVSFLTPTEILTGKQAMTEIPFYLLIDSLFRRISAIIDNYTDSEFVIPYSLAARKPFVNAEYHLKHMQFQTSGQPISGVVGTVRYFGDITRYLPYIDLGSQIHMGKKTTRACGEYGFEM